jgi:hypothetical protein
VADSTFLISPNSLGLETRARLMMRNNEKLLNRNIYDYGFELKGIMEI